MSLASGDVKAAREKIAAQVKFDILKETQAEDNAKLIKQVSRSFICESSIALGRRSVEMIKY